MNFEGGLWKSGGRVKTRTAKTSLTASGRTREGCGKPVEVADALRLAPLAPFDCAQGRQDDHGFGCAHHRFLIRWSEKRRKSNGSRLVSVVTLAWPSYA